MRNQYSPRKLLSLFFAMTLLLSLVPAASAAETEGATSSNLGKQDYTTWSKPVTSYLYENEDGGLTRVEYVNQLVVVEDYDSSFALQSSRTVPAELPIWGGFFAGEAYNFLVFGQENSSQDDNAEVIRVVKYSKDWQRLGQASLKGANTTVPFDAGSLRFAECGGMLYIRTCHEMYQSSDGLNHQSNLTMAVRQSSMAITDSYYEVMNISYGYVSHSFNQFILVDQDKNLVALEHGDAYPRSAVLVKYNAKAGQDKFRGQGYSAWCTSTSVQEFAGAPGQNTTGASLGGLAETSSGYVTAYNYDGAAGQGDRIVYLGYTRKSGGTSVKALSTAGSSTPVLAPTGLAGGYILWNGKRGSSLDDTLYYATYSDGGKVGGVKTASGAPLSDCQPILYHGQVVWYVTNHSAPTFYTLDETGVTAVTAAPAGQPEQPTVPAQPEQPTVPTQPEQPSQPAKLTAVGNGTVVSGAAVKADGSLVSWSGSYPGADGEITVLGTGYVAVSQAENRYMGLKADGSLWLWGEWEETSITQPVKAMDGVQQISGYIVLKKDGSVWSGNYTMPEQQLQTDGYFTKVMDGCKQVSQYVENVGLAVTNSGALWSWGKSWSDYYLGRPTDELYNAPGKVMDDVAYVNGHLIIRNDGSLWSWGVNQFGAVGDGVYGFSVNTPVKIMDGVSAAWSGTNSDTAFALTGDGSLFSWGSNGSWQLGYSNYDRTYTYDVPGSTPLPYQSVPRDTGMKDVAWVSGKWGSTLVLKPDGTLWVMGDNSAPFQVMDGVLVPGQQIQAEQPAVPTQPDQPGKPQQPDGNSTQVFSDVQEGAWYKPFVDKAVAAGLMSGMGDGKFEPEGGLTMAQSLVLAYQLHSKDSNASLPQVPGPWYAPYYQYCVEQGILSASQVSMDDMDRAATRFDMVSILDKAIPTNQMQAINTVADGYIPDLALGDPHGPVVYKWYRAGALAGDSQHRFNGGNGITRAEVSVILCQLAGVVDRIKL